MPTEVHSPRAIGRPAVSGIRRTLEVWTAAVGMVLSVVCLGGFVLVMNQIDAEGFESVIMPVLFGPNSALTVAEAQEIAHGFSAWFGFSLIVVLFLAAAGIWRARVLPGRKRTGFWFLAAGLTCLLGSQFVFFPVAFFFFFSAGLFAVRSPRDRSTP